MNQANSLVRAALVFLLCAAMAPAGAAPSRVASAVHNYVFFGLDRQKIHNKSFLNAKALEGAQLKYTWRELEPKEGAYDFRAIESDLNFLTAHGKRLFIQIQDSSFAPKLVNVPEYLITDPRFHGGADLQYSFSGDDEKDAVPEGWVARRWDPAVRERFAKLLAALGKKFDGKIAGINLPETAVDFGDSGKLWAKGFTPTIYRDSILAQMAALKKAFPKSVAMQYANFMPGEWLPWTNHHYLEAVYARAKQLDVGVGGPDLLPWKRGQMSHDYKLIPECAGIVPTGIAVQDGNYAYINPKTGKQVTLDELYDFAAHTLKVNYIFWGDQEPDYTRDVLPFLKSGRT